MAVNENMIRAAARYWDSRDHVFRFGDDELSPTFAEFYALFALPTSNKVFVPVVRRVYVKDLADCLLI